MFTLCATNTPEGNQLELLLHGSVKLRICLSVLCGCCSSWSLCIRPSLEQALLLLSLLWVMDTVLSPVFS